ncbi:MAG: LacI family DNA-binding transcriptional regulator [Rhodobacteraceae bacterium]|nr:LacI family DNA-binding transcriptional regulator [Paracoccaceae bacterium]
MVTLKDIGRALGLSHATVSRALGGSDLVNPATRARVVQAAREMGYSPDPAARLLRGAESNLVGLVLPDIRNNFYSRIAKSVASLAADRQLQVVLSITDDDPAREERLIAELARARARAIVITPSAGLTGRAVELLSGLSVVQMVRAHPALVADLVAADDREGVASATMHLVGLGLRRIVYLGGDASTLSTGRERVAGYRAAMDAAGLASNARAVLGPPQPGFGRAATARLLQEEPRPEAIVLGSSQLVTGFLEAAAAAFLSVPRDMAFTGYDDPDWFALWGPGISTVELPSDAIARAVVAFAAGDDPTAGAARVDGDSGDCRRIFHATGFCPRGSTGTTDDNNTTGKTA